MSLLAQNTGTITGRVFNPGSGEYVRNVELTIPGTNLIATTADGGYYTLHNVPAGEVTVVANYPGAPAVTHTVTVTAGATATHDFEVALTRDQAPASKDETIVLQEIKVETEREGQAKMIAEQKQAMNIKQVMSSDVFGDMSEQNVGEFLKYLPGITIDYVETDTRTASMGGMDPKYGYVTLDGNAQASGDSGSFGSNTRQFEFESISMNNIESIEVNKTLTADMWADAPAGTVNLRTRSALDVKRPRYGFTAGMIWNAMEPDFKKTPRHDDDVHAKVRPRFSFDYSSGAVFGGKWGFSANGSFTNIYKLQYRESMTYDYSQGFDRPRVTSLGFKDGPKLVEKSGGGIKVDYQPFRTLRLTSAASYTFFNDFFANRNLTFQTTAAQLGAGSNINRIIANNSNNNTDTQINQTGESTGKWKDNTNLSLGAEYKLGAWQANLSLLYSRARERRGGLVYGTIGNTPVRLSRITWEASRPSQDRVDWTIRQTGGPDWYDWNNWGIFDAQDMNSNRQYGKTEQYTGKFDVKRVMDWRIPTTLQAGIGTNVTFKHRWVSHSFQGRYVGPTGNALTSRLPLSRATFNIDPGFGGGVRAFPVVDKEVVFSLLRDNPSYFTQTEANLAAQIDAIAGSFQSNQESIRAAYLMHNSRLTSKLQMVSGVRMENTRTITTIPGEVPIPQNPFRTTATVNINGVPTPVPRAANTVAYQTYRYYTRPRETVWGEYTDVLPSAAFKYTLNPNMFIKAGYNKAIKRPDLNRTSGRITYEVSDATGEITAIVPNPDLKPERSERFSVMLDTYWKHGGSASVHVYQSNLKNAIDENSDGVSAEEAGFGGDPDFAGFLFETFKNLDEKRVIRGIELSYSQQLRFFSSEWLRGTTVFVNYSQRSASPRPRNGTRFFPRNAAAGASWKFRKFFFKANTTWTDSTFVGETSGIAGQPEYFKPRTIVFVEARYELTRNFDLFVSGDRAFDSGKIWYFKSDGRIRQEERYGSQWSVGIRGHF